MLPPRPAAALSPRIATAGLAAATTTWLVLLVVSPYLVSHSGPGSASFGAGGIAYLAGRVVCHQRADRSFRAWGVQLPVCGRCLGLYAGAVLGSLFAAWRSRRPTGRWGPSSGARAASEQAGKWPRRLAIAALPTAASVGLEIVGLWAQSPPVRFAAAIPLGFTVAWFVGAHAAEVLSPRQGTRERSGALGPHE